MTYAVKAANAILSYAPRVIVFRTEEGPTLDAVVAAIVMMAGRKQFSNCIVVGATEERARELLAAITRAEEECEKDARKILTVLGIDLTGRDTRRIKAASEAKLELSNGVVIQALGRGHCRGVKHLDRRPDCAFVIDIETDESVADAMSRHETGEWFWKHFLPALDRPDCNPVRIIASSLHEGALAESLPLLKEFRVVGRVPA